MFAHPTRSIVLTYASPTPSPVLAYLPTPAPVLTERMGVPACVEGARREERGAHAGGGGRGGAEREPRERATLENGPCKLLRLTPTRTSYV